VPTAWTHFKTLPRSQTSETLGKELDQERFDRVYARLWELSTLHAGWDGYGARPLDHATAVFAAMVIGPLLGQRMPEPFVAPLAYGGLQFEWHIHNANLEVEFRAPYEVDFLFQDENEFHELPIRSRNMSELIDSMHKARERLLDEPARNRNP
jgi:hypothetical protein